MVVYMVRQDKERNGEGKNRQIDGLGTISIFDHDTVSVSNLHRQVLHTTSRVGMNKAQSASLAIQS